MPFKLVFLIDEIIPLFKIHVFLKRPQKFPSFALTLWRHLYKAEKFCQNFEASFENMSFILNHHNQ